MSTAQVSELRRRVAAAVKSGLTYGGQTASESRDHPDVFPVDAHSLAHRAFVVSSHLTDITDPSPKLSIRTSAGGLARTLFRIRWSWNIQEGRNIESIDAAIDSEQKVLASLAQIDRSDSGPMRPERVRREGLVIDQGVSRHLTTLDVYIVHRYNFE